MPPPSPSVLLCVHQSQSENFSCSQLSQDLLAPYGYGANDGGSAGEVGKQQVAGEVTVG